MKKKLIHHQKLKHIILSSENKYDISLYQAKYRDIFYI